MRKTRIFSIIFMASMVIACAHAETDTATISITAPAEKKSENKSKSSAKPSNSLKAVEARYSATIGFTSKIKKSLHLKLLDQDRTQEGTLKIKKTGKFRLELDGQEKSLAVTDGKTIWVVTFPTDPAFDNIIRVARSREPKHLQSQALLTFLLGKGSLLKQYQVTSTKVEAGVTSYDLKAKDSNADVPKLVLHVDEQNREIKKMIYWDNLENQTTLEFSETKFDQKLTDKDFQYQIPMGAEITDL